MTTPLRLLEVIARWAARLSGIGSAITVLAMTVLITVDVLGRYLFNKPTQISVEVSGYLLVALVFLGLAYTEGRDRHIVLTFLTDTFPLRLRWAISFVGSIVSIVFSAWLVWLTAQPVIQDYALGSISLTGLRTPQWVPESLIPVGFALLTVQLLTKFICETARQEIDSTSSSVV